MKCNQCNSSMVKIERRNELSDMDDDVTDGQLADYLAAEVSGDYFSRFVFEYLAFIAHVKNNLFFEEQSDRKAMQSLKQRDDLKEEYLTLVKKNKELSESWELVIQELAKSALYNNSRDQDSPEIDKWWNSADREPCLDNKQQKGRVFALDDWGNMVEFWCAVRNNLFHGGKNPNIARDIFLVEHAYKTLSMFVNLQVNKMYSSS